MLSSTVRSPPPCAGKQHELQPLGPLPTLMLDGFDMDGVWGQLELRNEPLLAYARSQTRREQKSEQGMRKEERMAEAAARREPLAGGTSAASASSSRATAPRERTSNSFRRRGASQPVRACPDSYSE